MENSLCEENIVVYQKPSMEMKHIFAKTSKKKITVSLRDSSSLYELCSKYIAIHFDLLDSLIGFPEILGKELFKFVMKGNEFFNSTLIGHNLVEKNKLFKLLSIFDQAYGALLLSSLKLGLSPVYETDQLLCCFKNLEDLDLSYQSLSDDVLGSFSLIPKLKNLVLRGVDLTDERVKTMTLPFKMYKERSKKLNLLDISENRYLTSKVLVALSVFNNLKILNISSTDLKFEDIKEDSAKYNWEKGSLDDHIGDIETKGWCKELFVKSDEFFKKRFEKPEGSKASNFYNKPPPPLRHFIYCEDKIPSDLILKRCNSKSRCIPEKTNNVIKKSTLKINRKVNKRVYFEENMDSGSDEDFAKSYLTNKTNVSAKKRKTLADIC